MLREYQKKLVDDVFSAYNDGFTAPCIVLPCGGGKSIIVAEIAKQFTEQQKNVLLLVHRKELCGQIFSTFVKYGVKMEYCEIAMVQTVCRHLDSVHRPKLIITDENHHSLAKSYKKIYDYFSGVKRVGVTATPERINGAGLADVNDKLIVGVTAKWLIEHHYLAPYDYYAPGIKLPKFHIRNGEYNSAEVNDFFQRNRKKIYGDAIKHYKRLANGKQAICYLPSVEISKQIANEFTCNGISAAHIDGETPEQERNSIIERFRTGEIKILCNVDIISEGFDVPDCECTILLRPTKSLTLFIQQSMRSMRYKPNKRAIIIDHVNNIESFGFPDAYREWLLEGHPHKSKEKAEPMLKICRNCFAAVPINTRICPRCGKAFPFKKSEAEKLETELVNLNENIKSRVKYYLTPNECTSVEELQEYAKQHGYKPGWVYYQQKNRGWLNGTQKGNGNTKRYPCRAIPNWNMQAK